MSWKVRAGIQAVFFGVGGLIHVAVGLAGGTGGFSRSARGFTKRLIEGDLAGGVNGVGLTVGPGPASSGRSRNGDDLGCAQSKKRRQKVLASSIQPKRLGTGADTSVS
jgi:hypothetical protein